MSNAPLLSIIIPTYNSEATIQKTLSSLFNQSYTNYEIIIIDGQSVDNTLTIIKDNITKLSETKLKLISEKDNGIYDAMNKGIIHAKGEWLYFLGSDDVLYNNEVLQHVKNKISSSNSKVVYGNVYIDGDAKWAKNKSIYDGDFDLKKLLIKNICHQAIFYKSSLIKNNDIKFNCNYPICADWDFNLRCWSISEFNYLDLIIAKFNAGGVSTRKIPDPFSNELLDKIITYFEISNYFILKNLLPKNKQNQFLKINKYKWIYKADYYITKLFN